MTGVLATIVVVVVVVGDAPARAGVPRASAATIANEATVCLAKLFMDNPFKGTLQAYRAIL